MIGAQDTAPSRLSLGRGTVSPFQDLTGLECDRPMNSSKTIAQRLGAYFSSLRYEDLPRSLIGKVKTYVLDWIGSAVAGAREMPTKIMLSIASELGKTTAESTIIPTGDGGTVLMAALINGASSHVKEMDDLHRPSIFHPAAPIMPAALAACEKVHGSGKDLIMAVLAGYEVGIRAALAAGKSHYALWHTTATCGTFGAAAAAAKALQLDQQEFTWALGSAGTQASGLWQFLEDGAMSKQLHTAKAAFNGLLAALLAKEGLSGPHRIFEGNKGFLKATLAGYDMSYLTDNLGHTFYTEQNSLKYFASCGHTHTAVQAALDLRAQLAQDISSINSIRVYLYAQAIDLLGQVEPSSPYLAKFHIPFCVANALCYGHVGIEDFCVQRLQEGKIKHLISLTSLHEDPAFSSLYPRQWPARVEILLKDGQILKAESHHPKGDPENPLSERELIEKFKTLCADHLSEQDKQRIIEMVLDLERFNDVRAIFGAV